MKVKVFQFVSLLLLMVLTLTILVAPAKPAQAYATWYVNPGGSIQTTVDNANLGDTIIVAAGTYVENVNIPKSVTLKGAQYDVNVSGRVAASTSESTIQGLVTVDAGGVNIDGFTITNPSQTNALSVTPSHSNITITYNIVDNVGGVGLTDYVHAILLNQGPDSVTIADNRFNNIKSDTKSVSAVGVLSSASTNSSTGLVIQDNTFTDIASASGAYGIIINNAAGAPGAQIKDNTFSGLNGGWTHAIGLEGPTPSAIVTGNIFSVLTAADADNAAAIFFEDNPNDGTVTVSDNEFNGTAFYGVAIHPDDLPGGSNSYNYTVTATKNWWGDSSGPGGVGPGSGAKVSANVLFTPWTGMVEPTPPPPTPPPGSQTQPTEGGSSVTVDFGYIKVTFPVVNVPGDTWLGPATVDTSSDPAKSALSIVDIGSNAAYQSPITIAWTYDMSGLEKPEGLKMYHFNGSEWENITTSVDTANNIIYGQVSSLSPFLLGLGGCFIATAAYGSPLDSHVDTLRSFRDNYLETNPLGSAFVSLYYKVSPPMADFIDKHPALKPIVRVALIPAVAMSSIALSTTPLQKLLIMLALLASLSTAIALVLRQGTHKSRERLQK